jgi:dihydropteroate synthase
VLDVGARVHIMGVLNVTPDSFADGGWFFEKDQALRQAERMVAEGADIIDVGGESSRPGADPVSQEEELARVIPVIEALAKRTDVPISIDTYKAEVAARAFDAGAQIINDISACRLDDQMAATAAKCDAPVVLMHMEGTPKDMQQRPHYDDVLGEICAFLEERIRHVVACGVAREKVVVDPGIGFGKTVQHNLEIIRDLSRLLPLGCPVLIGPSRKSFVGQILDLPAAERLEGTLAAVVLSVAQGAHIVRVHDVREAVRAVRVAEAILGT